MVTPRSRKTRFKSKIAKVVFGHLFLSIQNRSKIVSISSHRAFFAVTDNHHKVGRITKKPFCATLHRRF
jgi:hypothetical protein